ncbi:helix-turn-helix domain-containing protein [Saccharopolyspora erythraea]|uniref:helix-turn-helix domain-containing protein n=1 Tax=Saccharopolyspora erythraea TaxID=1836 RepID=UPI00038CF654|nr:helix-turn-helix transcriptional regulator [Saccharopolyspora erythraea]EQD85510.1 hypothetical protein N599_14600 [Saccharopolyspora erythraea D]
MTDPDPTVRGQQLGEELRTLRKTNALSLADAAERIDASAGKLSRFAKPAAAPCPPRTSPHCSPSTA